MASLGHNRFKPITWANVDPDEWEDMPLLDPNGLTLNVRGGDQVISVWLGQYHSCSCPGSLRRQDISNHDIDYVK